MAIPWATVLEGGGWTEGQFDEYNALATVARGQLVLLFDDLYRSVASMNLYRQWGAADVVALTITQTRSNR